MAAAPLPASQGLSEPGDVNAPLDLHLVALEQLLRDHPYKQLQSVADAHIGPRGENPTWLEARLSLNFLLEFTDPVGSKGITPEFRDLHAPQRTPPCNQEAEASSPEGAAPREWWPLQVLEETRLLACMAKGEAKGVLKCECWWVGLKALKCTWDVLLELSTEAVLTYARCHKKVLRKATTSRAKRNESEEARRERECKESYDAVRREQAWAKLRDILKNAFEPNQQGSGMFAMHEYIAAEEAEEAEQAMAIAAEEAELAAAKVEHLAAAGAAGVAAARAAALSAADAAELAAARAAALPAVRAAQEAEAKQAVDDRYALLLDAVEKEDVGALEKLVKEYLKPADDDDDNNLGSKAHGLLCEYMQRANLGVPWVERCYHEMSKASPPQGAGMDVTDAQPFSPAAPMVDVVPASGFIPGSARQVAAGASPAAVGQQLQQRGQRLREHAPDPLPRVQVVAATAGGGAGNGVGADVYEFGAGAASDQFEDARDDLDDSPRGARAAAAAGAGAAAGGAAGVRAQQASPPASSTPGAVRLPQGQAVRRPSPLHAEPGFSGEDQDGEGGINNPAAPGSARKKRRFIQRWREGEVEVLIQLCVKYGLSRWSEMLKEAENMVGEDGQPVFVGRIPMDLKDKARGLQKKGIIWYDSSRPELGIKDVRHAGLAAPSLQLQRSQPPAAAS